MLASLVTGLICSFSKALCVVSVVLLEVKSPGRIKEEKRLVVYAIGASGECSEVFFSSMYQGILSVLTTDSVRERGFTPSWLAPEVWMLAFGKCSSM